MCLAASLLLGNCSSEVIHDSVGHYDGCCLGSYFDCSLQQSPSSSGDRTEEQVRCTDAFSGSLYLNS